MTCTTCTKVKPVSDCASSVVIGTIENAGADVIVTVNNVTLNRVDKYETTADGDGLVTIEGIKLSRFTYEITVALASAPDLNIIWSITDGSITQNVNCAVFKAASGGAEKLLPIPGTEGVVPNPPTGLGTNDISDNSVYQEANLTDALNKIAVDAQQTQGQVNGLLDYVTAQPKVYRATLSQSGTDAPVVNSNGTGPGTPLENTLGVTPVWSYIDVGFWQLTSVGLFVIGKTQVILTLGNDFPVILKWFEHDSNDNIKIVMVDLAGDPANGMRNSSIQILIYP